MFAQMNIGTTEMTQKRLQWAVTNLKHIEACQCYVHLAYHCLSVLSSWHRQQTTQQTLLKPVSVFAVISCRALISGCKSQT